MKYDVGLTGPLAAREQRRTGDQVSLLTDQTAVVTGGAQGLGYAIAERFIAEGARWCSVTSTSTRPEAAAEEARRSDVGLARCAAT